jgi:hypothetical protein
MANKLLVPCPHCGSTIDLEIAWNDLDGRKFVELLMNLPPVVVQPLYRYLKLFKPPMQSLRWSRILSLAEELAPLIKAAEIQRNKISYRVPAAEWAAVLTYLVETPPATLTKPLKSNGYLLSILADRAAKAATIQAEKTAQVKQDEKESANRAFEQSKQAVEDKKRPTEINPEFKQKIMEALSIAKSTPLTPEQRAEQLARLEQLKADAKREEAALSDQDKAKLAEQRKQRVEFEQSINSTPL